MSTLGISIGTRKVGIALITQGQLIQWRTHSFHDSWSEEKGMAIVARIERYISQYGVRQIVAKVPPESHYTKALSSLLDMLSKRMRHYQCILISKTKTELKQLVPEIRNSKTLMEYLVEHYAILLPEQYEELTNKRPYHITMFEAVLAAHVGSGKV